MNPILTMIIILATVAGIFFVWGTSIASVKHIGVGGILLTIALICAVLLGAN